EDEKKKSDAVQAATAPNPSGSGASAPPASGPSGPGVASAGSPSAAAPQNGTYRGGLTVYGKALSVELRMSNGSGVGTVTSSTCGTTPMSVAFDASGNVIGEAKLPTFQWSCALTPARVTGRAQGNKLLLVIEGDELSNAGVSRRGEVTLTLGGASVAATGPAA